MFITNYNIPWSLAALLLRNTCHFQDGCLNWKLHSSLIFWGERISSLQHTMPPKVLQHSFDKYFSLQIKISLEVLQHYFWETHAFFKMPFSIGNYIHLWSFLKENFFITIHNTPWSVAALFSDLLKITCLFQNVCFNWDMHYCLTKKCNSFLGNVYNFVWKNFFITIQIVPGSVAAILLKHVCLFHEDWFNWEM